MAIERISAADYQKQYGNNKRAKKGRKPIIIPLDDTEVIYDIDADDVILEIVLPFELNADYSLNTIYSGIHWSTRKQDKEMVEAVVHGTLRNKKIPRETINRPVELEFYYNDGLDALNHSYVSKMIEDTLIGYLLVDDNRKYVRGAIQRFWGGKGVKLRIREIEEVQQGA